MAEHSIGKITQIIGAVLDIKFADGNLPEINDAIRITRKDGCRHLLLKLLSIWVMILSAVSPWDLQTVLCVVWRRIATGAPITVPVGEKTLGRMFNVSR